MHIEFLIFLVICFFALIKFREKAFLHVFVNLIMFGFYAFLWWMMNQPYTDSHHGDRGLGFAFMTIGTIPFYFTINIFNVLKHRKRLNVRQKNIFYIHLIGLILGLTHLGVFLYKIL
jgi:hypothetical protein